MNKFNEFIICFFAMFLIMLFVAFGGLCIALPIILMAIMDNVCCLLIWFISIPLFVATAIVFEGIL